MPHRSFLAITRPPLCGRRAAFPRQGPSPVGLVLATVVGCSPTSPRLPTAALFEGAVSAADTSAPSDSGAPPDTALPADTSDTAEPGDPPESSDAITCADPSRRAAEGPFEAMSFPDFPLQDPDDELDMTNASGLAVGDMDGDGRLDILLPQAGPPVLLMQQEDGTFVDETSARWTDATTGSPGSAALHVFDMDGDGDLDVFLCGGPVKGYEEQPVYNQLFENDGNGHLSNVSEAWGLQYADMRACFGAAFGDIDGDGDLDMAHAINQACVRDFETGEEDCDVLLEQPSSQVLWENTGSRFVDISDRLPRELMLGSFAHVITLVDVDGDQDLDLYVTNDKKREIPFAQGNLLFRNNGDGEFSLDDSGHGLALDLTGMGLAITDDNNDTLPDFLMSSTRRVVFMVSDEDWGWFDASMARGLVFSEEGHIEPWSVAFVDVDHDTDLDVPVTFGYMSGTTADEVNFRQPDAFFENQGDDTYLEVGSSWGLADRGVGRGMVVIDIDGDGWLDILKRELGGSLVGWRSVCDDRSWAQVQLSQGGSNPDAIGAVVSATVDGRTQRQWVTGGGTSFASNSVGPIHFGLGEAEQIDTLRVVWPDGESTVWTDLPARRITTLHRGE